MTETTPSSYLSPLLSRRSATQLTGATHGLDTSGVAWHYGNPLGEQFFALRGSALIDRSHRGVLRVSGPDAGEFLNNLLSQKLDDASPGFSASALDLNIQGHILHHVDISRTQEGFYLDAPRPQVASLLDFLQKMIFWSQVSVEEVDFGILTVLGKGVDKPPHAEYSRQVRWPLPRTDYAVPRAMLADAADHFLGQGAQLAGLMTFTALRVKALEPELGVDLDHKSIPHEAWTFIGRGNHLGAVHLNKGCYRGQETVARVENLGRSPRLLVQLQLDGSAPQDPHPGEEIRRGNRVVGRLGTVVHHAEEGPIALGLIKRSALEAKDLLVGDVAASVDPDSLPLDEGEKAGRAAIAKLRGQG